MDRYRRLLTDDAYYSSYVYNAVADGRLSVEGDAITRITRFHGPEEQVIEDRSDAPHDAAEHPQDIDIAADNYSSSEQRAVIDTTEQRSTFVLDPAMSDSRRVVTMTLSERTSSSSSLESTEFYDTSANHYLIRIPEPEPDKETGPTNVNDLSHFYATMRMNNKSASEIEEFEKSQIVMLVPGPPRKFRMNWIAIFCVSVACVMGGAIGYGIAYYTDNHSSHRLLGRGPVVAKKAPLNTESVTEDIKLWPKINEVPDLEQVFKEVKEADKLQSELPDIIKSHARLSPDIDDQLLYKKRISEDEENARNRLRDEAKSVLKYIHLMGPKLINNCTSNCEPRTFFTRLPSNANNTTVFPN